MAQPGGQVSLFRLGRQSRPAPPAAPSFAQVALRAISARGSPERLVCPSRGEKEEEEAASAGGDGREQHRCQGRRRLRGGPRCNLRRRARPAERGLGLPAEPAEQLGRLRQGEKGRVEAALRLVTLSISLFRLLCLPLLPSTCPAMELPRGTVYLALAMLALAATVNGCLCLNNKHAKNCSTVDSTCKCTSLGTNTTVDCGTLSSKCLLMKAEMRRNGTGKSARPKHAIRDNDGIYDPECDENGNFKAKQCNGTSTCWCVNSAGIRRTDKGDKNIKCDEVVRTSWISMEMKHSETDADLDKSTLESDIRVELSRRYKLNKNHITATYEKPFVFIELKQNATEKSATDVDIVDVAYYFEKDIKGDSLILGPGLTLDSSTGPLQTKDVIIYYIDDKAPEFTMQRLAPGVIAVIVIIILAIVAGILVLVFTRRKKGKYEKAEVKEMNEMHRELNS